MAALRLFRSWKEKGCQKVVICLVNDEQESKQGEK